MNRYQIYLDPQEVSTLDQVASRLEITRSQIIRDVIKRVAREYEKVLVTVSKIRAKHNPLLKMAGMIKTGKTSLSENIDSIYFRD